MYKVSILVPVYGVQSYIERCARSLFAQTYSNLEFVFVDDASPDKSVEVLKRVIADYPDKEVAVTIIHHNKNLGIAATRDTLVNNCKGEFLFYVDSDDWIEPNAIELLVKRQQETEADIVTGIYCTHIFDDKNTEINKFVPQNNQNEEKDRLDLLKDMLKKGAYVATWNRLIRSSLYRDNNIQYIKGIDAGEDLLITPRLVYFSCKVAFCNAVTYHYTRSRSSSYVNVFPHSIDMQLQLISAAQLNVDFFRDKEPVLRETISKQLVERLKKAQELAFEDRNRKAYNKVIAILDNTEREYWPIIEWDNPKKRWLDHHYHMRKSVLFKLLPSIRRRLIKRS